MKTHFFTKLKLNNKFALLKIIFFVFVIIFLTNLNAIIDWALHPDIPYFDKEHVIVGSITGLFSLIFIAIIYLYINRLMKNNIEKSKLINELIASEQRLKDSEEKTHQILDAFDDPIYISNPDYTIFYVNNAMEKMIGKGKIDTKCYKSIYNLDEKCTWCQYEILLKTRKLISYDIKVPNKEQYRLVRNIIFNTDQKLSIYHDITTRKKTEHQLKELIASKDKLYSIIAHDLRSPFNSILGLSELLMNSDSSQDFENTLRYTTIINSAAKNTLVLLDNLLDWGESQTGQINFSDGKLILSSILKEIIEIYTPIAMVKNISLNYNQLHIIEVYTDKNMLKAVLRNLFSNAIKFTKPGGNINVFIISEQNQVEISISDNGIGMNDETRKSLFDMSTNMSTPGTANEKGSGLGLVLCKEFVEKLGGNIWVESEEGKGSDFKFTLPLNK